MLAVVVADFILSSLSIFFSGCVLILIKSQLAGDEPNQASRLVASVDGNSTVLVDFELRCRRAASVTVRSSKRLSFHRQSNHP